MKVYLFENYLVKNLHLNGELSKKEDLINTNYTVDNCPSVNDCIILDNIIYKVEEKVYTDNKIILFTIEYKDYLYQQEAEIKNTITEVVSRVLVDYLPIVVKGLFK